MTYPDLRFPDTPPWAAWAVNIACERAEVRLDKWAVPLEAIGRYESNWGNAANLCKPPEENWPLASFQLARGMFRAALKQGLIKGDFRIADPEQSAYVAICYIAGRLDGYGGYSGIGTVDGKVGLLARPDRGPGNVLRAWIADPDGFNVETARELYRGY